MIVAAYRNEIGTVYINDAAYRDASAEELRRREANLQRVAWDIAVNLELRGVKVEATSVGPPVTKLDMNDPDVIREIQEYEATKQKMKEDWERERVSKTVPMEPHPSE